MKNMNIVIASDSFKGSLSSLDICELFKEEIKNKGINATYIPLADGGEGSLEAISCIKEGRYINVRVKNLYSEETTCKFYIDNFNNAYIETASCVGVALIKEGHNGGRVTTYGLGEQIKIAVSLGIKNIYIFLGGSASNDGGCGLASALGVKFYNKDDEEFVPTGFTLKDIVRIDPTEANELLNGINIYGLADVRSPLLGKEGATYKYGPQKGLSNEDIKIIEEGMKHYCSIIEKELGIKINDIPSSGAAGGLGAALYAFAHASISSGIETILDLAGFDTIISQCDLVISGEGKLDKQTYEGKVIDGIAKRCIKYHIPLDLIVGISTINNIKDKYPCIENVYETNVSHQPFEEIKWQAKQMYTLAIKELLKHIDN